MISPGYQPPWLGDFPACHVWHDGISQLLKPFPASMPALALAVAKKAQAFPQGMPKWVMWTSHDIAIRV